MLELPPLSLYIHVPWCIRKCPYCDFNSKVKIGQLPEESYVDSLLNDLKSELPLVQKRNISSIFIGGGTPSLFSADSYKRILNGINDIVPIKHNAEISMEANPGTFEQNKFKGFKEAGINRLSIGIQSFDDEKLKALGRIHNAVEAIKSSQLAAEIFTNINLDIMHGLPDQTPQQAINDLQQAITLQPTHLSWYQLTIEPDTAFYNLPPKLPPDDDLWLIQQQGQEILASAGFEQYEVSAYSKVGQRCKHNNNYWTFGDYLGIGAGAHGKITLANQDKIIRRWKHRHPDDYINPKTRLAGEESIARTDRGFEFMLNALRLKQGVSIELLSSRTGLELNAIAKPLERARQRNLLIKSPTTICPTSEGYLFLNDLICLFMPDK